ncbi:MAG: SpoIIE family protein phosphatase [Spirochaetales bacterium]|nr:SpoIIE family protein phosphatase [Spirochaetales bacterium]
MTKLHRLLLLLLILIPASLLFSQDLYWEEPELAIPSGAGFSQIRSSDDLIYYFWQEHEGNGEEAEVYISMATSINGIDWEKRTRFLGPFLFTGNEIQFYSVIVKPDGEIFLAVSEPDNHIKIYSSIDDGDTFTWLSESAPLPTRIMPRFSQTADGGFILFATLASQVVGSNNLGISYSLSSEGRVWTEFKSLTPEERFRGTFLPTHTDLNGRDYVVFQSFTTGDVATFQLYSKYSDDGGNTWSAPVFITDFFDPLDGFGENPFQYDNQRPNLGVINNQLNLTWERSAAGQPSQIFHMLLDRNGGRRGEGEQISRGNRSCEKPQVFGFNNDTYLLWFDNRAGDYHVVLSKSDGLFWDDLDMTVLMRGNSTFPSYINFKGDLYLFWENEKSNRSALISLAPDKTVSSPLLRGSNFSERVPVKQDDFVISWNSPADSSGIAGYSYILSRDKDAVPPRKLMTLDRNRVAEVNVEEDGLWYFHLTAEDYAGNWSEPSTIVFNRDTTPPEPVLFAIPEVDEDGMLLSNTSTLIWEPPVYDPYITSYTYRLQYIAGPQSEIIVEPSSLASPPSRSLSENPSFRFYNRDNGYYALTVKAIDVAGNIGLPKSLFFRMNKYIPVTYVTRVGVELDELGAYSLSITGRGFSVGGDIEMVILDLDKQPPYDIEIPLDSELYAVETDRYISGPILDEIYTGDYWVGVVHPERGLHFSRSSVELTSLGTVKFGDFEAGKSNRWQNVPGSRWTLSFNLVLILALMVFLGIMLLLTSRRLVKVVQEGRDLQREVRLLLSGPVDGDEETKKRISGMKKKGIGLRFKFVLMVTILVLIIVAMISVPLAVITSGQQEEILAQGLEQRAEVLLESLASGARTYLPTKNLLELGNLPAQMGAMGEDAVFVTITSQGIPDTDDFDPESFDYIWSTNEDRLLKDGRITGGAVKNDDPVSLILPDLAAEINQVADSRVSEIAEEIVRLNEQTAPLVAEFIRTGDAETEEAINAIQDQLRQLDETLTLRLYEIGDQVFSLPKFDPQVFAAEKTTYIFFKPILYRSSDDDIFFRGIVRLGVSNSRIIDDINDSREQLMIIIGTVAVIAMALGVLGALLLAVLIIRPINILVRGVEQIRDAEKKQELEGKPINTKTKDELAQLAETINEMTDNLIEAEKANEMLLVGKDVQKQFIPLELLKGSSVKMTTGKLENDKVAIFGYYEGALSVSGDYFDFRKIDENHIAFIKCDVAGKGVPASLIMVQVATIFTRFFRNWIRRNEDNLLAGKKGLAVPNIATLVDQINDILDYVEVAKAGRFAAFIIGILDIETGKCELSHAGDKFVHIYDHEKGMYTRTLDELPSAGSFPSDLIEMKGGFTRAVQVLKKNDALILYTDGLEEAQRQFRNANYDVIICDEPGLEQGELHGTHPVGNDNEELSNGRIHEIVNTVFAKGVYNLFKYHNPVENEAITFDFSNCEGNIEDAVMALMSIEKVFRFYPHPSSGPQDIIRVDRKIDDFLKKHFVEYKSYFHHPIEMKGISTDDAQLYSFYSHLREDHQYDDLTVLGILKK